MIFVDTGYYLAMAEPRDEWHHRAVAWAAVVRETFITTEYVLWESINGLSKPRHRSRAQRLAERWKSSTDGELVPASEFLFDAGMELHEDRPDKSWSLTDCISFIVMEQRQITRALTPDRHFEQAGFEALLLRDPAGE